MKFTGERYIPSLSPEISYEHWHRYVFTAELAAGKSVLDIASGEGYGSHFIARVAERVVGIDLDPEAVAHAARQYARPNLEFRAGSVDAIPIEGRGVFDMVVSFETIEHVGEEAQSRFCEEVVRLLKPNGILLVSTPDKAAYSDAPKYHNEFHRREFYKGEFVELLSRFFPSVRLFGQKVYAGSHVWRLEGTQSPLGEYQLAHSEDRFRPATADLKQPLYLLAVCSNAAGDAPGDSVLIDASGLTTPVLRQDLSDTMQAVCDLRARVAEQDAAAARAAEASGAAAAGIAARDAKIRELEFKVREEAEKSRALAEAGDLLRRESDALRHELAARDGVIVHLQGLIEQERRSREGELNRRLNELEEASARRGKTIQAALGAIAGHVVPAPEPAPTAEERAAEERRYRREMDRMQRTVVATTPEGATVLVVSKGDPDLLDLEGRRGLHFPQSEDGAYAGFHPPDSPTAIAHLEFLRGKGAQFLLFPSTAFWWMDHYPYLREYLDANFDRVRLDGSCLLYRLQAPKVEAGPAAATTDYVAGAAAPTSAVTGPAYAALVRRIRDAVESVMPPDATVVVISKGDENLLSLGGRCGWHFPRSDTGLYAGFHPKDSAAAIDHLEALRAKGGSFLLIPGTAYWWLTFYKEFASHLDANYRHVREDDCCIIYELSAGSALPAKRMTTSAALPVPSAQPATSPSSIPARPGLRPNLVTVIVPVYNAYEETSACLRSLVAHGRHPHQVLLIDDRSPDNRIWPLLQGYAAAFDHFFAVRNDENRGFTATVNRGCAMAPGDVVLLNSDTEVTADWLEKLAACAVAEPDVATVTALSNAAGAFSVPVNNRDNEIPPPLTTDDMAEQVERLSHRTRPRVPTGNGFCLYVTRRALNQIGPFDERLFPRGYGEENDFCLRAARAGLVNLIDDATFVRHKGTASFLGSKGEHLSRGLTTLNRLYPGYDAAVQQWLRNDPLDPLRARLADALRPEARGAHAPGLEADDPRPCLLFIVHDGGGGTLHMVEDLARGLTDSFRCLILKTGMDHWTLLGPPDAPRAGDSDGEGANLPPLRRYHFAEGWEAHRPMRPEQAEVLYSICRRFRVRLAHVHHLLGSGPELIDALDAAGVPVIFSFHDFYAACPTIQLLDEEGTFCGGRCTEGPGDCPVVPNFFRGSLPVLKHRHVHNHRRRMEEALRKCRAFVAPSNATREVVTDSFPFLRDGQPDSEVGFRVVEHGRDLLPRRRLAVAPQPGRPARVICLGNIDRAKGADLIRRVMELDRDNPGGPRFEFHFLGNHAPSFRVERLGAVNHGPYRREDLPSLVESIAPSFAMIASIWPETFCYTLSEAWALGLPVFASDIGTLRERVDACAGGWLLDHADPERWYEGMVRALEDSDGYPRRVRAVAAAPLRFVADMAEDYLELYQALLGEKRWAGRVRPAPAVEASPAVNLSSMK